MDKQTDRQTVELCCHQGHNISQIHLVPSYTAFLPYLTYWPHSKVPVSSSSDGREATTGLIPSLPSGATVGPSSSKRFRPIPADDSNRNPADWCSGGRSLCGAGGFSNDFDWIPDFPSKLFKSSVRRSNLDIFLDLVEKLNKAQLAEATMTRLQNYIQNLFYHEGR